jgi:hypothetical protein
LCCFLVRQADASVEANSILPALAAIAIKVCDSGLNHDLSHDGTARQDGRGSEDKPDYNSSTAVFGYTT